MAGDWIKLHRRLLDNPIMQHAGLSQLWLYCILRANWRESKTMIPGTLNEIVIPRGSFLTGRFALHKALYPKSDKREQPAPAPYTLWRWLLSLESMGCLTTKTVSSRCTLVSVVKYSDYQSVKEQMRAGGEQVVSSTCAGGEQVVSTVEEGEEDKEDKEEKEEKKKPIAASPLAGTSDAPGSESEPAAKTPRPRDFLWDAIVEITGADATIRSVATHIGRVKKALLHATPPYTPEEVLRLREVAAVDLPWCAGRRLTLGEVEKNIGLVRSRSRPVGTAAANGKPDVKQQIIDAGRKFIDRGNQ